MLSSLTCLNYFIYNNPFIVKHESVEPIIYYFPYSQYKTFLYLTTYLYLVRHFLQRVGAQVMFLLKLVSLVLNPRATLFFLLKSMYAFPTIFALTEMFCLSIFMYLFAGVKNKLCLY